MRGQPFRLTGDLAIIVCVVALFTALAAGRDGTAAVIYLVVAVAVGAVARILYFVADEFDAEARERSET